MCTETINTEDVGEIISEVKTLAKKYKNLTGKPLGITGEVAEYEAANRLNLILCDARQEGHDAIQEMGGRKELIQIKGRCIESGNKNGRVGSIKEDHEWDFVVLVLLDKDYEPISMHKASRSQIIKMLNGPGSKARNEKRQMSINQFKGIATRVWIPGRDR